MTSRRLRSVRCCSVDSDVDHALRGRAKYIKGRVPPRHTSRLDGRRDGPSRRPSKWRVCRCSRHAAAEICRKKHCRAMLFRRRAFKSARVSLDPSRRPSGPDYFYLSHCYTIAWHRLSNQFLFVCVCMYVCICGHAYGRIFQPIFTKFVKNLWGLILNRKN